MIGVLGIPLDENSSFLTGTAAAPDKIRMAFHTSSANYFSESGIDLSENVWTDFGNVEVGAMPRAFERIEEAVTAALNKKVRLLSLGGDHSISYPIIKTFSQYYEGLTVVQFDAHPDLYDTMDNNPYSHASPFARLTEGKFVRRLVQIGIRTLNTVQQRQAEKFGVEQIHMREIQSKPLHLEGPIYISLDLDVLDPAFAPGISHHEPGGMTTRELINWISGIKGNVVGADLVEFNPSRDINGITAMVAAKLFKELLAKLISADHA